MFCSCNRCSTTLVSMMAKWSNEWYCNAGATRRKRNGGTKREFVFFVEQRFICLVGHGLHHLKRQTRCVPGKSPPAMARGNCVALTNHFLRRQELWIMAPPGPPFVSSRFRHFLAKWWVNSKVVIEHRIDVGLPQCK